MNYLPREGGTPWGRAYAAGLLLLGGIAIYMLLDGDGGIQTPEDAAVATAVPSATSSGAPLAVTSATATPAVSGGEYEVVEGDSAWLIAEKLDVPVDNRNNWVQELLALNGVDELELQVGQTLVLPPIGSGGGGTGGAGSPAVATEAEEDDEDTPAAPAETDTSDTTATEESDTEAADDEVDEAGEDDGRDADNEDLLDLDDLALEDDDGRDSTGINVQVDSMNVGACATIDNQTYCYGGGGTWNCDRDGDSMRCSGPAGQSTTCTGSGSSITCEAPTGESTTCTVDGDSTVCSSNNENVSSDSNSQNCTVLGSATLCFESGSDDDD